MSYSSVSNSVPLSELASFKVSEGSVNQMRFSLLQEHIFATASDSGEICIFDLNAKERNPLASMQGHKASARGIAFSPLNKLLLSSVSIDKGVNFYDITKAKKVSSIVAPEALQSIAFNCDGHTVAAGAVNSGKIYIYDLRNQS